MTIEELQRWLNNRGAGIDEDGKCGPATRAAILKVFTNKAAPEVTDSDITVLASRLGCTVKQIKAVAQVESGGSAFDKNGRPKMLFERHLFHRLTSGKYSYTSYSNDEPGGYNEGSWEKLMLAACKDVDAAFKSCSWGKFQVLGMHQKALGYNSPIEMAYTTVTSEQGHYELLARFIDDNNLKDEIQALSTNPADNVAFARAYNGPQFKKFNYDEKLAKAMA